MGRHGPGEEVYLRAWDLTKERRTFPVIAEMLISEGFVKTCHHETARRYAARGKHLEDIAIAHEIKRAARMDEVSAAAAEWTLNRMRNRRLMAEELDTITTAVRLLMDKDPMILIKGGGDLLMKVWTARGQLINDLEGVPDARSWPELPEPIRRMIEREQAAAEQEGRAV